MTADRVGVDEPVAGVCCRCRVRHDDELCCACGIVHRGDEDGRSSLAEVLLVSASAVAVGAVVAVCAVLSSSSDTTKLLAAIVLVLLSIPAIRWALTLDEHDSSAPAWMQPGTFRNTEPKESSDDRY